MLRAVICVVLVAAAVAPCGFALSVASRSRAGVSPSDVLTSMKKVNDFFIDGSPRSECGWTRGTYFAGDIAHYDVSQDKKYFDYAQAEGDHYGWEVCNWPHTISENSSANDIAISQMYARMYQLEQNKTFITNTLAYLDEVVAAPTRTQFWWIDAFFMGTPVFAAMANITGNTTYSSTLFELFSDTSYRRGLWSAEHNLYFRDASFFDKTCPNGEPVFWARGNGWAIAAMARILHWLPKDDPTRINYAIRLNDMAYKLLSLQGEDGFWRSSLLDANECPGPETTGTSMFTFAIASGVNNGYLVADTFRDAVLKAWNGLASTAVQSNGLLGYCQPAAGSPGNATATDTSDFCVGQFLLAGSEVYKMVAAMERE